MIFRRYNIKLRFGFILLIVFSLSIQSSSARETDKNYISKLSENFKTPPSENNPYVWWHWINGNITKDGITKDLEWMKKVGINGAIIFNVGTMDDEIHRDVKFRSKEWWAMVEHAGKEADRLGLKLGIHNCDGWSHSGGPWVKPEESMKEITYNETFVSGGTDKIVIPTPATKEGFYRDIAILAYPVKGNSSFANSKKLSSNLPDFDSCILLDNDKSTKLKIHASEKKPVNFTYQFDDDTKIASVSVETGEQRIYDFTLDIQVSEDGGIFKTIKHFKSNSKGVLGWNTLGEGSTVTLNFEPSKCKYLRLNFTQSVKFVLSDIAFSTKNRIEFWEAKSAQIHYTEHGGASECYSPDYKSWNDDNSKSTIQKMEIVDLTQKLEANNVLNWTPKNGKWKIVRIGYTSTGKTNSPSTVEGRGLETDKLDPEFMEKHYDSFMSDVVKRAAASNTRSMKYTEIDSWEVGVQNWTEGFQNIFKEKRGYDMIPFLPVLICGQIVESYEVSERFLWDYRRTLADLIASSCFEHLADLARKDGLKVFAEGSGRQQYLYDPINYSRYADIPKGEFWAGFGDTGANLNENPGIVKTMRPRIDCKVASSVAHIYGGQLASAESFTGGAASTIAQGPFDIKMLGDKAFTMGINYMVLHTSVHQPYTNLKPGFSLGGAGSFFTRNNIIYENCNEWMSYLSRCQYLLRQGKFVADVCYFTGDNVPNYLGYRNELSVPLPKGYDYDGINSDIILNHMSVANGKIVLSSGMEYRVLLLPDDKEMEWDVLSKIKKLVAAGATVIGPKPQGTHGLNNYQELDSEVKKSADEIWGKCDGLKVKENSYGKGKVIWGKSFEIIFEEMNVIPDFQYSGTADKMELNYIHRKTDDAEIYFVANSRYREENIVASFRVKNKTPYLFYASTGKIVKPAEFEIKDGFVKMPLHFDPAGSVFVVFANEKPCNSVIKSTMKSVCISMNGENKPVAEFYTSGESTFTFSNGITKTVKADVPKSIVIGEKWDIVFPQVNKPSVELKDSRLFKWNESNNDDIKYFSGTAIYKSNFIISKNYIEKDVKLNIDLGKVRNLASIKINGKLCAGLWKEPFRADISSYVKEGKNTIEIDVTDTWTNRLIGDEQLPADIKYKNNLISEFPKWMKDKKIVRTSGRTTFTLRDFYKKDKKLIDAGLFGPIEIKPSIIKKL